MYAYLKFKGIEVMGDKGSVPRGQTGNENFNVKDPDGRIVEIVEYQPDSWTAREAGKFMPPTRIADHIMHVGVLVGDLEGDPETGHDDLAKGQSGLREVPLDEFIDAMPVPSL